MSNDLVKYSITVINSSGAAIKLKYGSVHEWWQRNPNEIVEQGFIEVEGGDTASGTFTITASGQEIQVDFNYTIGKDPTLSSKSLIPGPFVAQIDEGPYVQNLTAFCTLNVIDPQKRK